MHVIQLLSSLRKIRTYRINLSKLRSHNIRYFQPLPHSEQVEKLARSKQLLEEEVGRSKAANDTLRKELQSEHKDNVKSLSSKCVEYEERLGKLCTCSDHPFIHHVC